MNKVKVTAATAGLVAALGLSYTSSAYADDVDATVDANASESTSNASQNTVTQADVDTAKASVESANQAVSRKSRLLKRQLQLLIRLKRLTMKPHKQQPPLKNLRIKQHLNILRTQKQM